MKKSSLFHIFFFVLVRVSAQSSDAEALRNELRTEAITCGNDSIRANLCNELALGFMRENDDSVQFYADRALEFADRRNVPAEKSRAYSLLGNLYVYQGKTDSAYKVYLKALNIDIRYKFRKFLSEDYMHIAKTFASKGDIDKAIEFLFKGMDVAKKNALPEQEAECLFRLAVIYDRQDEPKKAIQFCENAISIQREIGDSAGLAYSYHRMGLAYEGMGNYNEALKFLTLSYDIRKSIGAKAQFGASLNGIGLVHMDKEEYQKALIYFYDAYKSWSEANDKEGIVIATGNLGELSMRMGDLDNALKYFLQSNQLAEEIHALSFQKGTLRSLATIYYKKGEYKTAYDYFSKFSDLRDKLYSDENSQRMAQMQSKYQAEQKEQQIKLLTREKQLQDSDNEKKSFFLKALTVCIILLLLLAFMIFNRYRLKQKANEKLQQAHTELEQNRDVLAVKNKEITDSIKYAKRLQEAILPGDQFIRSLLPESFVFYKPKDIVSGDFYWFDQFDDKVLFAAVDCTGHGVPGAFMSIVGYNLLNQALNEKRISQPNLILNAVNRDITKTLRQSQEDSVVKDGMDIALCSISRKTNKLEFAGAYNSLWLIREGKLTEYSADKYPIGLFLGENIQEFTHHEITLQKGDLIYIYTDGFADQFGGPKGKKFKYKNLQQLLREISDRPMDQQKAILEDTIESWKGSLEQVDDILIIGIRV